MRIFLIDIDGTIAEDIPNERGPQAMLEAKPFLESIAMVNKLYAEGHFICFFTARKDEHREATETWLKKHGVKHHQVIYNKPRKVHPFDEYHFIDDSHVRATTYRGRFTDFVKKKVEIDSFAD